MKVYELNLTKGKRYKDQSGVIWAVDKNGDLISVKHEQIHYFGELLSLSGLLEVEFEPYIDWTKIPEDTKVWVRDEDYNVWEKAYFAFEDEGMYFVYADNLGSWTVEDKERDIRGFSQIKLASEEE